VLLDLQPGAQLLDAHVRLLRPDSSWNSGESITMKSNRTAPLGYLTSKEFAALHNPKWGVVFKDLNNPDGLFTAGPARADRLFRAVSPAPVDILRTTP
jgi:hypothetical protein